MASLTSHKAASLYGTLPIPGDKSISHRSLIFASQAVGTTRITGLLEGDDVLHTADALREMGVSIEKKKNEWVVHGVGVGGLREPKKSLYLGNSGTGVRLLMGLVGSHPFTTNFSGDESLSRRPMKRVSEPLSLMGIEIKARDGDKLPLSVTGSIDLVPIEYEVPVPSAQVKSAILLAALNVAGRTTVIEKERTRDHTERMLRYLGAEVEVKGKNITLTGQPELTAKDINVPADPSSAAFPIVAALITPGSDITVKNICMNPLRTGLFVTLKEMGADIEYINERSDIGEPIADIRVKSSALNGVEVPAKRAPSMIDEYPILAIAASVARGKTTMNGLKELKVKESDRLAAIAAGLRANGVSCTVEGDTLIVEGQKEILGGGKVITHMDHRIAMSFLVMGMVSKKPVAIDDAAMISTSFPSFIELMNKAGARFE